MFLARHLPSIARSIERLRDALCRHADTFDLVSFDVFDTLLRRRVHPPKVVQQAAARWFAAQLGQRGVEVSADEVLRQRRQIERRLRAAAQDRGDDRECRLTDVIRALAAHWLPDEESSGPLAEHAECYEFELERAVTGAVPGMPSLLDALRRAGKRVVLCSDMYLSSDQIGDLLISAGYALDGVRLYVSSEARVGKGSGRLFRHMLGRERVDAARVVHVGDHAEADVRAARGVGLRAIHFRPRAERQRHRRLETLGRRAEKHIYWRGAYVNEVCQPLKRLPPRADFYYDYGRTVLGLPHAVFLHAVIERVERQPVDQLLFVAREGFLYRQIYERLLPSVAASTRPATSYVCLTRRSTDPQVPSEQRHLLARYLDQAGFWGSRRKVALVDVGWLGTIGHNLRALFGHRDDFPQLAGLYLGRFFSAETACDDSSSEGLLRDPRRREIAARSLMEFIPLFEESARAPHGTTNGYAEVGLDTVEAVLDDGLSPNRVAEVINNPALGALQQGIVDFAERYAETVAWTGYTSADMLPYVHAHLTRAVCLPRGDEARSLLAFVRHAADQRHHEVGSLGRFGFRPWRPGDWDMVFQRGAPAWRQGMLAGASRALSWMFTVSNYLRRWTI